MRKELNAKKLIGQICFGILLLYLGTANLLAQSASSFNLTPPKVVPPSPEVASLFKFSELPVTHYTGLPGVAVPIFDLKLKDISIPISLQYHTGAVKVDEVASNVGIGWALNAGGSINVMVRGKEDWLNGYPANGEPITEELLSNTGQYDDNVPDGGLSYNWCKHVLSGLVDPEPDFFNFSAPGINGKFFYDQQSYIHTVPVQPLKIARTLLNGGGGYRVINAQGVIYDFHEQEVSSSNSGSANYNWYLSRIITPARDTVIFTYQKLFYKYKNFFGEGRAKYVSGFHDIELLTQVGEVMLHDNIYDTAVVSGSRLRTIACNNGTRIDLTYASTQRSDLPGTNALTAISVFYGTNFVKKFNLVQQYVGNTASPDRNRLRLTQVYEEGADGLAVAPYKFFYNDTKQLPDRLDNGQDHWGYYNGKNQGHRVPRNDEYWPEDINSANREPDTSYSRAGIITAVQYPTGGTSTFDWEPNDIWVENERTDREVIKSESLSGVSFTTRQVTFIIPTGSQDQRIFYNTYAQYVDPLDDPPIEDPTCNIMLKYPDGHTEFIAGINSNPNGDLVSYPPGQYTLTIDTYGENTRAFFRLEYKVTETTYFTGSRIVGGWRIKRITHKDPFHPAKDRVQRFTYAANDAQPGKSGGIMPTPRPVYEYFRNPAMYKRYRGVCGPSGVECELAEYKTCLVIVQSANSLLPLWNDHGHIFYPTVTVYEGENGENGKTVYYYSYAESGSGHFGYPFTPGANADWLSGILGRKDEFSKNPNGTYSLVKSTESRYSTAPDSLYWRHYYNTPEPIGALKGIGMAVAPVVNEITYGFQLYPAVFNVIPYHYVSKWHHLDTTIVTESTGNPGEILQTVTSYSYANGRSLQPTEIKVENSKRETNRITNTYPNDYSTAPYQKMVERNIIAPVIEEKRYNGGSQLLLRTKTNYDITNSDLVLPATVERSFLGQTAYTEITYSRYDDKGNIIEYTGKDGVVHSFIWGYNKNFPVAEIVGSNYNTAISFINPALLETANEQQLRNELNKIRTGLGNANALVSTYTYSPLVGMTSSTDPSGKTTFYEYDGLGRLKILRDQNGKILKQNDYQYQKPLTQ
jgi:YD repeat-containing protein